jgi:hypothetical protein
MPDQNTWDRLEADLTEYDPVLTPDFLNFRALVYRWQEKHDDDAICELLEHVETIVRHLINAHMEDDEDDEPERKPDNKGRIEALESQVEHYSPDLLFDFLRLKGAIEAFRGPDREKYITLLRYVETLTSVLQETA